MVVDLAETVGLEDLEDNHKGGMDLGVETLGQEEDTSRVVEARHMAYQGMEDQEDHRGPSQQVVEGRMEVDIEDGDRTEGRFVQDLGTREVDLVEDLALEVCDAVGLVLEPARVLGVEGAIRYCS